MDELDEVSLARAQKGDVRALSRLVSTYERPVFGLVSRMLVRERGAVEDLAQEIFLKVIRAIPRFDARGSAKLSTWILTIATRACIDELRRRRRSPVLVPMPEADDPVDLGKEMIGAQDPEVLLLDREFRENVLALLESLPEDQRAVLILRAYHDMDYPEIAVALGLEEGTVKSRLSRARAVLRRAIDGGQEKTGRARVRGR